MGLCVGVGVWGVRVCVLCVSVLGVLCRPPTAASSLCSWSLSTIPTDRDAKVLLR